MNNYNLCEKKSGWHVCYRDYEGKKHQKLLKNCRTKEEAEKAAAKLSIWDEDQYLIKNIAGDMYLPGSHHLKRLTMLGKDRKSVV